jgi:hypothetical protein
LWCPFFGQLFSHKTWQVIDPLDRDCFAKGAALQPVDHSAVANEKEMCV